MKTSTEQLLQHHWALDQEAAEALSERLTQDQHDHIEGLVADFDDSAIEVRDANRRKIGEIFTKTSHDGLMVVGPCSLDDHSDYGEVFDYIEHLQADNPDAVIGMRANGAKPRTGGGWTGLWYSTDPEERAKLFQTYRETMNRGIPIISEVTQATQLGALAPWMSGFWLGARDISSTALRTMSSAIHLPVGIKNGIDGNPQIVANTVKTITGDTEANEGSGVDLGTIASTPDFAGIATGLLPVGEGNHQVAIFARGYELPESLSPEARRAAALNYLSAMCLLGSELGSAVLIDGSHDVPPMFDIKRKDPNRIIPVLEEFNQAIRDGQIENAHQLAGVIAEVGPNTGKTDPNYVLDECGKRILAELIKSTLELVTVAEQF